MDRKKQFLLTPEQHETRRKYIGGSDAGTIMEANPEKLIRLWKEKRGELAPEDLSGILPVCFGTATEELNRYWFEIQNPGKKITREGEHVVSSSIPFMACSLDGYIESDKALFEAKTTGGFETMDKITQRYIPQLFHSMWCLNVEKAYLSVFLGTGKWAMAEVRADSEPFYMDTLHEREKEFWACVQDGTPPAFEPVPLPVVGDSEMREVDMEGNNAWAFAAGAWLETRASVELNKKMGDELKLLVDFDVRQAKGYGVKISRGKDNRLRLYEL